MDHAAQELNLARLGLFRCQTCLQLAQLRLALVPARTTVLIGVRCVLVEPAWSITWPLEIAVVIQTDSLLLSDRIIIGSATGFIGTFTSGACCFTRLSVTILTGGLARSRCRFARSLLLLPLLILLLLVLFCVTCVTVQAHCCTKGKNTINDLHFPPPDESD